ncbi:MAG: hypothetical protein QXK93_08960, partial [Candidatus Bathyarchaeia archaeon]
YNSTTIFKEAAITKNVIKGIWLIPEENQQTCRAKIIEKSPGHYLLQINNPKNSWLLIFLGENYDPRWEAAINETKLQKHKKANIYGNLWTYIAPQGISDIQISYEPNVAYKNLLLLSLTIKAMLIIVAYLPTKTVLTRLLYHRKKLTKAKTNEKF